MVGTVLFAGLARVEVLPLTVTLTVLWPLPLVLVREPRGLRDDAGSGVNSDMA